MTACQIEMRINLCNMIGAIQPDCVVTDKQLIKVSQKRVKQQENLVSTKSTTKY